MQIKVRYKNQKINSSENCESRVIQIRWVVSFASAISHVRKLNSLFIHDLYAKLKMATKSKPHNFYLEFLFLLFDIGMLEC